MVSVFFRSRPSRMEPAEVVARLADALPTDVEAVLDGGRATARWHDGAAPSAVAEAVAAIVNWPVSTVTGGTDERVVVLDRSLSDGALAVAVVRFAASHPLPYDSGSEKAVAVLAALLDTDDPAISGYPMADAMATRLLAAPEPEGVAGDTRADRLAAKLTALGYAELWKAAWAELT